MKFSATFFCACSFFVFSNSYAGDNKKVLEDYEFRKVKSNSSSRTFDVEREVRNTAINSDEQVRSVISKESKGVSPLANGIPKTVLDRANQLSNVTATKAPTADLRDVWKVWCESAWDETCEGVEVWNPPATWDICRFNLVEESKSRGQWGVVNADKTKITVRLKSWGTGAFFDRKSGWVRVRLDTVQLIASSATEEQRKTIGCSYNNGGGTAGQGLSEMLFCASDPTDPSGRMGIQMCADYIYDNGVKKYTYGPYACGVCFTN